MVAENQCRSHICIVSLAKVTLDPDEDAAFINLTTKQMKENQLSCCGNWLHKHKHRETTWCNLTDSSLTGCQVVARRYWQLLRETLAKRYTVHNCVCFDC